MIAEILPTTDIVVTGELMEHDCLEQVVRAAERAAIEAHRIAADTYRRRALALAEAALNRLELARESAPRAIGIWWVNNDAAVHTRNEAWWSASYAHEAGLCERQARTLGRRLAQLEARWGM